jgi:conjugative transposon TraN protein
MKRTIIMAVTAFFACCLINAQVHQVSAKFLEISYDKSLHIVFDNNVKYVDAAPDISVTIVPDHQNIVRVRADQEDFTGTRNISIVTWDGVFHSYQLIYRKKVKYSTHYETKADSSIVTSINVADNKSTHIIFPSKISYYDIGNEEAITAENTISNNILKIRSLTPKILPTSLFVVTEDKKNYEFDLKTDTTESSDFTYNLGHDNKALFDNATNDLLLKKISEKCLKEKRHETSVGEKKNGIICYLTNININNDILYFTFQIINTSNIKMNIDYIRCFIQDNKKLNNSPQQEVDIHPLLTYNFQEEIGSERENTFVMALPKFTIPDGKKFYVQIYEKDGGRHLSFTIKNKHIMGAKYIDKF